MVAQSGHAVADDLLSDPIMRRDPMADPAGDLAVRRDSQIRRAPNASGLYDVLDLILDKGIVIDAFVRVSLVGIELVTVDLRVVIASVDTYLRYAEGVERLGVYNRAGSKRLPDVVGGGVKQMAMKKGAEKLSSALGGGDDDDADESDDKEDGIAGTLSRGVKRGIGKIVGTITGGDDDGAEARDDGDEDEAQERVPREREPARLPKVANGVGRAKVGTRR